MRNSKRFERAYFLILLVLVYTLEMLYTRFVRHDSLYFVFEMVLLLMVGLAIGLDDRDTRDWKTCTIFFIVPSSIYLLFMVFFYMSGYLGQVNMLEGGTDGYPGFFIQIYAITAQFQWIRRILFSRMFIESNAVLLGYFLLSSIKALKNSKIY